MTPYVPLRVFSCFTMLEGAIEPKAIAKHAAQARFPGGGAGRPQRALCGDGVRRGLLRRGRAADRRRDARRRAPRRYRPARRDRLAGAARAGRGGLRQSLPPGLDRAPRPPDQRGTACRARRARRPYRRADRADRGRGGGTRPPVRRRPGRQGRTLMPRDSRRCSPTASTSNCRGAATRSRKPPKRG